MVLDVQTDKNYMEENFRDVTDTHIIRDLDRDPPVLILKSGSFKTSVTKRT